MTRQRGHNLQRLSRQTNGLDAVYVGRPSRWGNPYAWAPGGRANAVNAFAKLALRALDLAPLRGKNLACWCPLDQPCHADVLLAAAKALSNSGDPS